MVQMSPNNWVIHVFGTISEETHLQKKNRPRKVERILKTSETSLPKRIKVEKITANRSKATKTESLKTV